MQTRHLDEEYLFSLPDFFYFSKNWNGKKLWHPLLSMLHHNIVDSSSHEVFYKCIAPQCFYSLIFCRKNNQHQLFTLELKTSHGSQLTSYLIVMCRLCKYTNIIYEPYQPLWYVYLLNQRQTSCRVTRSPSKHPFANAKTFCYLAWVFFLQFITLSFYQS